MHLSAYRRKTHQLATLLLDELTRRLGHTPEVAEGDVYPLLKQLGIRAMIADRPPLGCSVAGSCDHQTMTISVVTASRPRMRFTALHELGHLLGADLDDFQDSVHEMSATAQSQVEEDCCDAFAALLLLPDEHVSQGLGDHGLTARGLRQLASSSGASLEACAVALAQRLSSPGYVLVVEGDGTTRFAARSGDALPIARGTDQSDSDLRPVLQGALRWRGQGRLRYRGGASTDPHYVNAVRWDELTLAVACESDPDWPQLQTGAPWGVRGISAHCSHCAADFIGWRRCPQCGEPVHGTCGQCDCETAAARTERTCERCFLLLPAAAFAADSSACSSCSS